MKRRNFLKGAAATILAATPAMKAAAMVRDFGSPVVTLTVEWNSAGVFSTDAVWTMSNLPEVSHGVIFGQTTRDFLMYVDFSEPVTVADGEDMVMTWDIKKR